MDLLNLLSIAEFVVVVVAAVVVVVAAGTVTDNYGSVSL